MEWHGIKALDGDVMTSQKWMVAIGQGAAGTHAHCPARAAP
jgi:hypothetical protein